MIFSIVLLHDLKLAFLGLITSVLLLICSKLPLRFVFRHVKWVLLFIVPFLAVMPFTVEGSEIFRLYGVGITYEGLRFGLLIATRALSAVILVFPMVGTMRFDATLKALYKLKVPGSLVQMLMFTYRYIFIFADEFSRMRTAMASKGFRLRTNLHTFTILGKAIGMLFVRGYKRAKRVYQAMLSAGYAGSPRTLVELKIQMGDYILASFIMGFAFFLHVFPLVIQ